MDSQSFLFILFVIFAVLAAGIHIANFCLSHICKDKKDGFPGEENEHRIAKFSD